MMLTMKLLKKLKEACPRLHRPAARIRMIGGHQQILAWLIMRLEPKQLIDLISTVYIHVFSSLIENLGDDKLEEILKKYGIKPNRNKSKRKGQLLNYFQKNKSDKNNIIDYLHKSNSGQIDANAEMTQLPDVENMSRQSLLDYCQENVPTVKPSQDTNQLRSTVFSHVFSSLIQNISDIQIETILRHYGIEPDKNRSKRKGQLNNFFHRSETRTEI